MKVLSMFIKTQCKMERIRLIVLDMDIFSIDAFKIKDIKLVKTMIDGEFVFKR